MRSTVKNDHLSCLSQNLDEWKISNKNKNARKLYKVISWKSVILLKENCIFFWCTSDLFSTTSITSNGDVRPCQRVECKKFYIDDLYFIYFLLPRSAKHFTKDIALSQSLQSNGSIWQICELQHFIRQERTKKGQGVESIAFSIIYLLPKHFQWPHSESCNENCIWSKTNLNDWIQFGNGTPCPDGCATGNLFSTDICLLQRSSFSSMGTHTRVRVLSVFTDSHCLGAPRTCWWIFIAVSLASETALLLSSPLYS